MDKKSIAAAGKKYHIWFHPHQFMWQMYATDSSNKVVGKEKIRCLWKKVPECISIGVCENKRLCLWEKKELFVLRFMIIGGFSSKPES